MMEKTAITFVLLAKQYCQWFENGIDGSLLEKSTKYAALLADLSASALRLPDEEPDGHVTESRVTLTGTHCPDFEGFNYYWEVFDPYSQNAPIQGSLRDDLEDIYLALKRGMILFETGDEKAMATAIWDWRFEFIIHWGEHATGALRALRAIINNLT